MTESFKLEPPPAPEPPKPVYKTCKTCRWAAFTSELTPTGRIGVESRGHCGYNVVLPEIPASIGVSISHGTIRSWTGANCKCWEGK